MSFRFSAGSEAEPRPPTISIHFGFKRTTMGALKISYFIKVFSLDKSRWGSPLRKLDSGHDGEKERELTLVHGGGCTVVDLCSCRMAKVSGFR